MTAKRVGRKYENGYLEYRDISADCDGWVSAADYLPEECDLCKLKLDNGTSKMGWSVGAAWEGARVTEKDNVLFWKRWVQ